MISPDFEKNLERIFEELKENAHKLDSWQNDRLEEWEALWRSGRKLSTKQLEKLEEMYVKV